MRSNQFYYMNHKSYLNRVDVSFAKLAGKSTAFYFVSIGQILAEITL